MRRRGVAASGSCGRGSARAAVRKADAPRVGLDVVEIPVDRGATVRKSAGGGGGSRGQMCG